MKSLTNIIFKNTTRKNQTDKKSIVLEGLAFTIVFVTIAITMIYFSYTITQKLNEINQNYAFVNILFLMNFIVLFTKSVFESLNILYFSKDLKFLLRMPLKPKDILNSKIINMIISEYEMEAIMLAIPMIVYGILEQVNILFYLYMLIILLILPIIPIIITSAVISVIMRFTNFIKDKSKVMYITIIFSIFIISMISVNFNTQDNLSNQGFENILLKANGLAESISNNFILIKPIMNTLLNYDNFEGAKNLIIYIVENIICYIIGISIMSRIYLKGVIGTTVNSKKTSNINKELKLEDFKKKTLKKAYLTKEKLILKRAPIFFIQCLIIPILYPIIILGIVIGVLEFVKISVPNLWNGINGIFATSFGTAIFIAVGQIFYMTNFSSIIAVSRESKYAKLVKYLPIDLNKQFKFKLNTGIKINMIIVAMVSICNYLCTQNIFGAVMIFIILTLLNIIGEKFKLLIDLRKPRLNWDSEYTMMKENTNVMYLLFYTVVAVAIILLISQIIKDKILYLSFTIISLITVNIFFNKYIVKNKNKIFSKIY